MEPREETTTSPGPLPEVKDYDDRVPITRIKSFVADDDTPSFFPSRHVGRFKIFPDGEKVRKIVTSPDESMVAIGSYKGRIALYCFDNKNGYQMDDTSSPSNGPSSTSSMNREYYKHPEGSSFTALAISPCNRFLAAALFRKDITEDFYIRALAISPCNRFLAAAWYNEQEYTGKFIVFDMRDDGRILHEMDDSGRIRAISFSGDSKRVAIGGETGWAIFSVKDLPKSIDSLKKYNYSKYEGDALESVRALSFCPGDDKLVVGGTNGYSKGGCFLFDSKGTRIITRLSNENTYATTFSPDGMIVAVGCENKTYLVSTAEGERIQTFDHKSREIEFSKHGTRVFCHNDYSSVIGYDVTSGEQLLKCRLSSWLSSFAVIGGQSMELLIAGDRESIKVLKTGRLTAKELDCCDSAISNDGQMMASCYGVGCKLFDATGEEIKSFWDTFDQRNCYSVAFSSKGDKVAVGGGGETVVYSVRKKADESDFEFETLYKIEDYPKQDNGDDYYVIKLFLFAEDGEEKIASVLTNYESNVTVIDIRSVKESQKRIDTKTISTKHSRVMEMLPETNQICVRGYDYDNKKWYLQIYNYNKGKLEDEKYKDLGNIKAVRLSHDRTKLLVVFDAKLKVYNFSATEGFDAINEASIIEVELSRDDARAIETISDEYGTSIVAIEFEGGSIDVCRFKDWEKGFWEYGNRLYTIATSGSVEKMFFRPIGAKTSIDNAGCHLIVASEKVTRSYEISLDIFSNPTDPFRLLDHCQDEEHFMKQCAQASNRNLIPFQRNLNGDTLLYAAFTKKYVEYVRQIIEDSPQAVMALYCNGRDNTNVNSGYGTSRHANIGHADQQEEKSRSIIKQYVEKNQLERLERYFHMHETLKCTTAPERALDEIVSCIATLAEYKATNALAEILDAGASGCIKGFVPGYKVWLLQANHFSNLPRLLKKFKIFQGGEQKPVVSISNVSPHTSSLSHAFPFEEYYEHDDEKKIQLNACRVLLPNLANKDVLEPLLNMSEEYEDGSASLKLFAKRSLRFSIDAAWYSWGRKRFLRQCVLYFIWLICVTTLAVMRRTSYERRSTAAEGIRIGLIASVSVGFIYFAHLEAMQFMRRKAGQYYNLSWNLQQVVALVCIFFFIVMEIARPSYDATLAVAALSQLLGWINLLYYMCGISEDAAWIIYALLRLIRSMAYFLSVLFLAVFACSLFFWSLELPPDAGSFLHVLLETLSMSFFSDFDPLTDVIDSPFKAFVLILKIMVLVGVTVISMNAMIAFISENFADILDDKIAVMAREKADMMMDLYCTMHDDYREKLERDNRWTFKLELQSTLDKIDAKSEYLDDGTNKRATKGDIVDLKAEMDGMKAELKEMHNLLQKILSKQV